MAAWKNGRSLHLTNATAEHDCPAETGRSPHESGLSGTCTDAGILATADHMTRANETPPAPCSLMDASPCGNKRAARLLHCCKATSPSAGARAASAKASDRSAACSRSAAARVSREIHNCVAIRPRAVTAISATASMTSISDPPRDHLACAAFFMTSPRKRRRRCAAVPPQRCGCSAATTGPVSPAKGHAVQCRSYGSCRSTALWAA